MIEAGNAGPRAILCITFRNLIYSRSKLAVLQKNTKSYYSSERAVILNPNSWLFTAVDNWYGMKWEEAIDNNWTLPLLSKGMAVLAIKGHDKQHLEEPCGTNKMGCTCYPSITVNGHMKPLLSRNTRKLLTPSSGTELAMHSWQTPLFFLDQIFYAV